MTAEPGGTAVAHHPVTPGHAPAASAVVCQSALFVAIFYGIQIIWERDAGVLTKLMVTPTPRSALITGKAFAAGLRSIVQAAVVVILAACLTRSQGTSCPGAGSAFMNKFGSAVNIAFWAVLLIAPGLLGVLVGAPLIAPGTRIRHLAAGLEPDRPADPCHR
jgi:ABC-type Na+ efflux pump permease subunit